MTPRVDRAVLERQVVDLRRQLARAEQRSLDASRTRSTFLANMSHELRTPLNAIMGYSELVIEELEGDALQEDVTRIHGAARRLLGVISDVLDLARIEAGRMAVSLEGVDANALIRDAVALVEPQCAANGNQLSTQVESFPLLMADGSKLAQIVQNLLDNAAKFTRDGTVQIRAGLRDETLWLEVRDDGIGIDPERLGHLFDAFTQGDPSTTRRYGGVGLGLALCKAFAEMMGGTLQAHSEVGVGSRFVVTVPVERAPRGVLRLPVVEEKRESVAVPRRDGDVVLVIDDDPSVHDVMRRTLEPLGFAVRVASSGEEGLRLAKSLRPPLITLDVLLPGMDGFEVLEALRSDPRLDGTRVLLMSMVDERHRAANLGAADYLVKPVERSDLVTTVERILSEERGTILVAEDDPTTREMVRKTLSKQGWSVLEARDGQEALQMMRQHTVHAVLLDLMMPEVDGFEVATAMRLDPALSGIPVVVLTAMDLTSGDLARLRGRVENVLLKGAFGPRDLLRQVRELVRPYAQDQPFTSRVTNQTGRAMTR